MAALTIGVVATLVFLTLISLGISKAYRALDEVSTHELRLQSLIGRIVHLDEVLTMSARMAAATGDLRWEERYRRFDPELERAIEEAARLAAKSYGTMTEATDAANRELVRLEKRAFALVREGRREEAAEILFGEAYEVSKSKYAAGMDALTSAIEQRIHQEREGQGRAVFQAWSLVVVSAAMLLLAWLGVFGLIRRHLAERSRAEDERRQLESHMQHTQKLESLGVLAGGIAHDFNNLLTVILGNSRVALADLGPQAPQRDALRRIRTAAEYAAELVDQILTYSGKPSVDLKPIDLSRLIGDMRTLLHASAAGRCKLELLYDSELPAVDADATQIRQVILNLVTNASEAAVDPGTAVTVRTDVTYRSATALRDTVGAAKTSGEYVVLEVADRGTGMDATTQARIFEPFFTGKSFGRGLGLASVLGIVRAHGGALEVESQPAEGTTIRALFPLSARPAVDPSTSSEAPPRVQGAGGIAGRILVVDDEPWVLEVAKAFLENAGYQVATAVGGHRGIELFKAQAGEFHAVVLDLAMPDLPGNEVLAEIRALHCEVPVIAVSGYNAEVAAERFGTAGFAGFLHKPYEPEALVELLRTAVGSPGHSER
jgi:signal transduction histidine kinase/ActR/RegA family two-component response regulator